MQNTSGIYPSLDRVLIKPDELEKVTSGGIVIPDAIEERHAMAQSIGVLVDVGPDCWTDYKGPAAKIGERVIFAKYGGIQVMGKDGKSYRIMNDRDITGRADEGVEFTDLKSRTPFAAGGRK